MAPTSVKPGQVTRFFIDTLQFAEDVTGVCWFHLAHAHKVACDPNPPPSPATSCPYISWARTIVLGQEDITWQMETPGHFEIGDVTVTKRLGHQSKFYCICEPADKNTCQKTCAQI